MLKIASKLREQKIAADKELFRAEITFAVFDWRDECGGAYQRLYPNFPISPDESR